MECHEVRVQVFTYMDGECVEAESIELRQHFEGCGPCARMLAFEVRIRQVVATRCCESIPADVRDRVLAALDQAEPRFSDEG